MKRRRILVAMSGGVDSSVAAALLLQTGYECIGITLQQGLDDRAGAIQEDARQVCLMLGIPHLTLDSRREFSQKVIEPFVKGYLAGYTPNPCIACNKHLKFGLLFKWALEHGFDYLATGHYACIREGKLFKAKDTEKDQSYVLYTLTNKQLKSLRFPLGEYTKDEVRHLAATLGLASANKPESQDICFVPEGSYASFIESYLRRECTWQLPEPGSILTTNGTILGTHEGIHHFTIGQRRGLGVYGEEPYYVVDIDAAAAVVVVGTRKEQGKVTALIDEINIMNPAEFANGQTVTIKHRYRGRGHQARAFLLSDNTCKIVFAEEQPDLTRGQALVLYDDDRVLGGGIIVKAM